MENEQSIVTGFVPLVGGQQWALTTRDNARYRTNIFNAQQKLDLVCLEHAMQHLLVHHDMLRVRVEKKVDGWQQFIPLPDDNVPLKSTSLVHLNEQEKKAFISNAMNDTYKEMDELKSHFFCVLHFNCGEKNTDILVIIVHHFITDMYAQHILLRDFQSIYQQLLQGRKQIWLQPKTTSYKEFAELLTSYAHTELQKELKYWASLPWRHFSPFPLDHLTEGRTHEIRVNHGFTSTLNPEETSLFFKKASRSHLQILDILLTISAITIQQWTKMSLIGIQTVDWGRLTFTKLLRDIDLSNTVGYIAANAMLFLNLETVQGSSRISIKAIIEQIQRIPCRGIGYEILKNMGDAALEDFHPHVFLNYLGRVDSLSSNSTLFLPSTLYQPIERIRPDTVIPSTERGEEHIENLRRTLGCIVKVSKGQLEIFWTNHSDSHLFYQHTYSTIETISRLFKENLQSFLVD